MNYRRRMWNMARQRIEDMRASKVKTKVKTLELDATLGDVFTSEWSLALLNRWHIWRPGHVVSGSVLSWIEWVLEDAMVRNPGLSWKTSGKKPDSWTDDHEHALIHSLKRCLLLYYIQPAKVLPKDVRAFDAFCKKHGIKGKRDNRASWLRPSPEARRILEPWTPATWDGDYDFVEKRRIERLKKAGKSEEAKEREEALKGIAGVNKWGEKPWLLSTADHPNGKPNNRFHLKLGFNVTRGARELWKAKPKLGRDRDSFKPMSEKAIR